MGAPFGSASEAQDRVNDLEDYEQELGVRITSLQEEMVVVTELKMAALQWIGSKRIRFVQRQWLAGHP